MKSKEIIDDFIPKKINFKKEQKKYLKKMEIMQQKVKNGLLILKMLFKN